MLDILKLILLSTIVISIVDSVIQLFAKLSGNQPLNVENKFGYDKNDLVRRDHPDILLIFPALFFLYILSDSTDFLEMHHFYVVGIFLGVLFLSYKLLEISNEQEKGEK